ncbi:hypothetical protein VTK26DRAFT_3336 [Humicola hyalothermophila]
MSRRLSLFSAPDQESTGTGRYKLSIAASIRSRASRLFRRRAADDEGAKERWGWFRFHPTVGRFQRHRSPVAEPSSSFRGSDGDGENQVGMLEMALPYSQTSSPTPGPPPQSSPVRARLSKASSFMLHSFPGRKKVRHQEAELRIEPDAPSMSPASSIYSDKESTPVPAFQPPFPLSANSSGSFRFGVQKAIQDTVDDNFHLSGDYAKSVHDRPPRVPTRTLWTIMSADSTDEQTSPALTEPTRSSQDPPHPNRPHTSLGFTWEVSASGGGGGDNSNRNHGDEEGEKKEDDLTTRTWARTRTSSGEGGAACNGACLCSKCCSSTTTVPAASGKLMATVLREVQNQVGKRQNTAAVGVATAAAMGSKSGAVGAPRLSENRPQSPLGRV